LSLKVDGEIIRDRCQVWHLSNVLRVFIIVGV